MCGWQRHPALCAFASRRSLLSTDQCKFVLIPQAHLEHLGLRGGWVADDGYRGRERWAAATLPHGGTRRWPLLLCELGRHLLSNLSEQSHKIVTAAD